MVRFSRLLAAVAVLATFIMPPLAAAEIMIAAPPVELSAFGEPFTLTALKAVVTAAAALVVVSVLVSVGEALIRRRPSPPEPAGGKWRRLRRSLLDAQPRPHMRC